MNRVYLDTSAYLAVLLGEKQSAAVTKSIHGATLCSSTLLLIEAERNLVQLVRLEKLSARDFESAYAQLAEDCNTFVLRDLTPELCLTRHFPLIRTPKSADMVHLRTAHWFTQNGGLQKFISLDENQLHAAREIGLPC
ncbi:MAG: type II toxin-antitoxin system VapC family toxin [Turneriella sp.]